MTAARTIDQAEVGGRIYRKGDHVGFVDVAGRPEVPLPNRWYILQVVPGRDAKVMEAFRRRDVCAYSPTIVRTYGRRSGEEARRPHLGRRIVRPLLPGLVFVPDFEAANPVFDDRVEFVEGWFQITRAGAAVFRGPARKFEIADRHGKAVLPSRAFASLSVDDMAELRRVAAWYNLPRGERFKAGNSVRIRDGVFADFVGAIERGIDSRGRLKVFVAALMSGASIELDEAQVEPVS